MDDLEGLLIYARCESRDGERVMHVTVYNLKSPRQALRAFSIGFCSRPIVSARSPVGWQVNINDLYRQSTEWAVPIDSPVNLVLHGERLEGFSVTLRPGWRRSWSISAQWDDVVSGIKGGVVGALTTHDCSE